MPTDKLREEAIRRELERVLASAGFARNERLSRFLRFVVERRLEEKDNELKESLIAVGVFGRRPDYDPKLDSIVRTEAGRLRARLAEYYAREGAGDTLVIEMPKGGYTPSFRDVESAGKRLKTWPWAKAVLTSLVLVLAAGAGWWAWGRRGPSSPIALAVLSFENLGGDPANADFAEGLTDEIISNLSVIEGLAVRSRTSSFGFKSKAHDAREAGRQLDVDYILEGSILRDHDQLRVNTQLIRVRDDFALWSGRFDRKMTDVFAIQDEISRAIVNNLRLNLGHGRRRYETDIQAYNLYLRATALSLRLGSDQKREAIDLFERVIATDDTFAPAYAGLASAYYRASSNRQIAPDEALPKMRAAAEKAIQLDPLLAEAHGAMAQVHSRSRQWDQAEKDFKRAIELNPNRSTTYVDYALDVLWELGKLDEAVRQLRLALKADPLSKEVHSSLAWALISAGQYAEAATHAGRALELDPNYLLARQLVARARFFQGKTEEAVGMLQSFGPGSAGFLGYAYAQTGRREDAEKLAASFPDWPNRQVVIYAGLGDADRVFEALDRMVVGKDERILKYLTYPELAVIRSDPRLTKLRVRLGFSK